jgi:hypothetical protein
MAHGNKYWNATQQAYVPPDHVSQSAIKKWVSKGGMAANSVRMLNGAFEIWYLLRDSIRDCEDGQQRSMMLTELEDAGDAGWGSGVQDLDDAFDHWLGPGDWTDDNWGNYTHTTGVFGNAKPAIQGATFCWGLSSNVMVGPLFAVHFFNALDAKLGDLKSAMTGHNAAVAALAAAIKSKNGKQTSDNLHTIANYAGKAKKLLFLAPKMNDRYAYYGNYVELRGGNSTGVLAASSTKTFLGALTDLDTFLSVHDQALRTGIFDNQTATAFAALTVALGYVPVLGGFYAEMVKNLPGFFANFAAMNEDYYKNLDRVVRDATNR